MVEGNGDILCKSCVPHPDPKRIHIISQGQNLTTVIYDPLPVHKGRGSGFKLFKGYLDLLHTYS